jgi:hypothetical protein
MLQQRQHRQFGSTKMTLTHLLVDLMATADGLMVQRSQKAMVRPRHGRRVQAVLRFICLRNSCGGGKARHGRSSPDAQGRGWPRTILRSCSCSHTGGSSGRLYSSDVHSALPWQA